MNEYSAVFGMAFVRILSACLEMSAALIMLKLGSARWALLINSILGTVGPLVLLLTTAIGIAAVAKQVEPHRLLLILVGITLVLLGTR